MYAITGATGHTGSIVAGKLLAQGQPVRVIGRDAKRLARFTARGAEAFVADVGDADALTKAFTGAKAVYAMIPPNVAAADVPAYQERVSNALAAAIKGTGVGHAVVLSSMGADKQDKTGPVVGLHHLEEKLGAVNGLQALYLRAAYFMENILAQAGVIKSMGILAGPLRSDLPVDMVASRDVGEAAAETLLHLDFQGHSARELRGPRDVTYQDVARIVGAAIGKPGLPYMQVSAGQLKPVLVGMGMSASMADLLLEMSGALNSGHMRALEPRSTQNTAPTTLEAFVADVFLPVFRGQAARA